MEQQNILVLFYVKKIQITFYNAAIYSRILYNDNLEKRSEQESDNWEVNLGEEVFFKGLYLKNNYAAFIFFV